MNCIISVTFRVLDSSFDNEKSIGYEAQSYQLMML